MDSEGWIDIPMVASFNRVKSLTPDLDIVKECMNLSSLLEVREEKVRLSNGESHRWVLPDAKPTTVTSIPTEPTSTQQANGNGNGFTYTPSEGTGEGLGGMDSDMNSEIEDVMSSMGMGNGVQPRYTPGEVENALMKNSSIGGGLGLIQDKVTGTEQEQEHEEVSIDEGITPNQGQAQGQGVPADDLEGGTVVTSENDGKAVEGR